MLFRTVSPPLFTRCSSDASDSPRRWIVPAPASGGTVVAKHPTSGLSVVAYVGDHAVLLAFDMDETKTQGLACFAVKCKAPTKGPYPTDEYFLTNRLIFQPLTHTLTLT